MNVEHEVSLLVEEIKRLGTEGKYYYPIHTKSYWSLAVNVIKLIFNFLRGLQKFELALLN